MCSFGFRFERYDMWAGRWSLAMRCEAAKHAPKSCREDYVRLSDTLALTHVYNSAATATEKQPCLGYRLVRRCYHGSSESVDVVAEVADMWMQHV